MCLARALSDEIRTSEGGVVCRGWWLFVSRVGLRMMPSIAVSYDREVLQVFLRHVYLLIFMFDDDVHVCVVCEMIW